MSNRIDKAIARAQAEGRVAFIGLVPIDPDSMERTRAVADMMIASGVDIVMVHIPNWMPWMEGGVLQLAARAPRNAGVTREQIFAFIKQLRAAYPEVPLIDMTLYCGISGREDVEKVKSSGAASFMIGSAYVKYLQEGRPLEEVSRDLKGIRAMCAYGEGTGNESD